MTVTGIGVARGDGGRKGRRSSGSHRPDAATPADRTVRLDALTGLRWPAAFGVFLYHAHTLLTAVPGMTLIGTFTAAASGVTFFFVLSGFVLAWTWKPDRSWAGFWQDRFARIWPSHAVTWAAAILVLAPVALRASSFRSLIHLPNLVALALLQCWVPSARYHMAGNGVSWSLCCEAFFYLCFPVIYLLAEQARRPWVVLAGATAAAFAVAVTSLPMRSATAQWWGYYFPPARLPEFVIGVVLARLVKEGRWPRLPLVAVAAVTLAAVFCSRWLPDDFIFAAATLVPLAALVATAATTELDGGAGWLRMRWLVRLGEISFAFYLVHSLVIVEALKRLKGTHLSDTVQALLLLVLGVAVAWLLNVVVERPCLAILRSRRRSKAAPARPDQPG
jgi:peptidoglycan/LPS O-acetylase OafA/YrhL